MFFKFIYFEREREHEWRWGGERERRERIPSRLHTVSMEPDVGLELMNHEIMIWAEIKSWMLNQLSHPGAPRLLLLTCNLASNFKWKSVIFLFKHEGKYFVNALKQVDEILFYFWLLKKVVRKGYYILSLFLIFWDNRIVVFFFFVSVNMVNYTNWFWMLNQSCILEKFWSWYMMDFYIFGFDLQIFCWELLHLY